MAYSDIKDPSEHFTTTLYTGNGSTQSITNSGNSDLKPDFIWTKSRSDNGGHAVQNSNVGAGQQIYPYLSQMPRALRYREHRLPLREPPAPRQVGTEIFG